MNWGKNDEFFNYYKNIYSFEDRKQKSSTILEKTKDTFPLIIQKISNQDKENHSFICIKLRGNIYLQSIFNLISEKYDFNKDESLVFFAEKEKQIILKGNQDIRYLYDIYKDNDGFLYIFFNNLDSFGTNEF